MTSQPTPCEIEAEQPLFQFSVCAPGHQSSISPMVRSLMGVLNDSEVAAGKEFEIEIALREALANAVIHGCRHDPSKIVECGLSRRDAGDLVIVVRDPGPGFDPTSVPSPVIGRNVYAPHGRGIYLITQLMDEAWFERGGREIHMVLKQGIRSVIVHANADDPKTRPARTRRRDDA